jgi:hypothetical protein
LLNNKKMNNSIKKWERGHGHSPIVEHLPSMYKALGSKKKVKGKG